MMRISPTIKVSFGLVLVTISVLLLGDLIGLMPSEERGLLDGRKKFSESLAVQFSVAVTGGDARLIGKTLDALVEREDDVLSAALRSSNGRILSQAGDHASHWLDLPLGKSTPTHVQVPVFQGQKRWGTVEIVFAPLSRAGGGFAAVDPFVVLLLYLAVAGFLAYWLFIKRTLRELDPRSVIPERVKAAFNALAEGLVILDEKGHIILANTSFARKIEVPADDLMGRKASQFNWVKGNRKEDREQVLPWVITLNERRQQTGVALRYETPRSGMRTFMVNTAPITDAEGGIRGVLATFDDLTDLEEKQVELKQTISQLECSREELREKAVELEYLATRDPLTGCLNRRAFFERCEHLLDEAKLKNTRLSCIMTDIDHFKSINDRHGHAAGDKVIQMVANELRANGRPDDIVGRYGGEEFCIALPGLGAQEAVAVAERLRASVKNSKQVFSSPLRITSSFGVAELGEDVSNPEALIDRADQALYVAKESGRNRVVCWQDDLVSGKPELAPERMRQNAGMWDEKERAPVRGDAVGAGVDPEAELSRLRYRLDELEEELAYSQRALTEQAGRDTLTDLPNRLLFFDRISQALNRGQRFDQIAAVLVVEIDMFQRINEALGAVVGDQLLRKVAERLAQILRNTDTVSFLGSDMPDVTVSRTGADEFGILLTDMHDVEMVTWIVKRILDSMAKSMTIDGHEIFITCNAGISLYPHDADTASALLEHASAARFKAKQRLGKNNLQFYSADINQESYRQLWFESQLHHALRLGELSLNYQPKIDLASGRITSMEALIRWNNPKLGQVPPSEFIPIAERTGLINEIGEWVIRSACRQTRRWQEAGFDDVGVAVNLSALQFRQKNLCEQIVAILDGSNLEPGLLELEITESAVMDNVDGALEMIHELHKAGVQFAIDDFGTGYSSLAYLKHLPVNTLKIDRSFLSDTVPDEQDSLIITAIIAMAHSMNLRVVAEGVETGAQKKFLEHLDCDEIQGYLVSKPVPEDDALALLRKHNSTTRRADRVERVI